MLKQYVAPVTRKVSAYIEGSSNFKLFVFNVLTFTMANAAMNFRKECNRFGSATWRSPDMLGNSSRSPIYPYIRQPFYEDIPEVIAHLRFNRVLETELKTTYRHL